MECGRSRWRDIGTAILREDIPYGDLTTEWLGIGEETGRMRLFSRERGVAAGLEVAERVILEAGARLVRRIRDGAEIDTSDPLLEAEGSAGSLHACWRAVQILVEQCSAIATRTAELVAAAGMVNPAFGVLGTRKHFPGAKALVAASVVAGGGAMHRLGLSESILIFDQHKRFFPHRNVLLERIKDMRWSIPEKKVIVEVTTVEEGMTFLRAGADGLQFDKVPAAKLADMIGTFHAEGYEKTFIAAGGINPDNIAAYARTGAVAAATSWMYNGRPLDLRTGMVPSEVGTGESGTT